MLDHYSLIAIGAGPAGESAASIAAFFGHSALVVERDKPGGAVTTTGGAPTKTLRDAALFLTGAHGRGVYGVEIGQAPNVIFPVIKQRVEKVARFLQDVTSATLRERGVDFAEGAALVEPGRKVRVTARDGTEHIVTGDVIVIATGSRPFEPPTVEFDDPDVWSSDEIWELGRIPSDILLIGGGPIGIEFATVFQALGSRVVLTDRSPKILGMMDGEMADLVARDLEAEGATLVMGVATESVRRVDGRLEVRLSDGTVHHPGAVLFGAGRVPNTDGLGLKELGVAMDARGRIHVDEQFRTNVEGVFAVGDAVGPTQASLATEQGRVAACAAFGIAYGDRLVMPPVSAVYAMPEVAGVGLTEEQARKQGIDYIVGRADFSRIPRGAIAGRVGMLKIIIALDDRRVLGVHCFGDIASEIVGMGQLAIHFGGKLDDLTGMAFNTPTYAYAYRHAAFDAVSALAARIGGPQRFAEAIRSEYGGSDAAETTTPDHPHTGDVPAASA
jgi:NAD(P) transhydrogenase